MCAGANRFWMFNVPIWEKALDTYYHKAFAMLALAQRHAYKYLVPLGKVQNLTNSSSILFGGVLGTSKIYTTTGFGPNKNKEMAGVDHLVGYMHPFVTDAERWVCIQLVQVYGSIKTRKTDDRLPDVPAWFILGAIAGTI